MELQLRAGRAMMRPAHGAVLIIMKFPCALFAVLLLAASGVASCAEDWITTDGKVYKNVTVVKVEDDAVTILHHDGGALVPLATLPPALQAKFHYDPARAAAAATARAQAERASADALAAEQIEAQKLQAARDAKYQAERTAVQNAQAAREAAEPKDDPLHTGQFTLNAPPDPNHRTVPDAFAKHDPDMPVVASPSHLASTARTAVPATNSPDSRILPPAPPVH